MNPEPQISFLLFSFTILILPFLLRVWIEVRSHKRRRVHVFELVPSRSNELTLEEDFDSSCFGDLRTQLLARGWREEHPGIFSRDPFAPTPPRREYHNRHSGIFRKKAR